MNARGTGTTMAQLLGDDLGPRENSAAEKTYAGLCINRHARDEDDRQLLHAALFGEPRVKGPAGFKGRAPGDETGLQPHGTEAAYQRHKRRREQACEPCLAAASKANVESWRKANEPVAVLRAKPGSRYRYPEPLGDAGASYRRRVREWGRAQGWPVHARGVVQAWLLNAYCDATGDVWGGAEA